MNERIVRNHRLYVGPFVPASEFRNNLYIENFAHDMTEEMLKDIFKDFGEIVSASIVKNKKGQFGFVCFQNPEDAKRALEQMKGKDINGKTLYVNWAQKKKERKEFLRQQRLSPNELTYSKKRTIFVKNLEKDDDESTLISAFSAFGSITSTTVVLDERGVSRGFGFVSFSMTEEAEAALNFNKLTLRDRKWSVTMAKTKAERDAERLLQQQNSAPLVLPPNISPSAPAAISIAIPMPPLTPLPLNHYTPSHLPNPVNLPHPTYSRFGELKEYKSFNSKQYIIEWMNVL